MAAHLPAQIDVVGMEGLYAGDDGDVVEAIGWLQSAVLGGVQLGVEASKIGESLTHGGGH